MLELIKYYKSETTDIFSATFYGKLSLSEEADKNEETFSLVASWRLSSTKPAVDGAEKRVVCVAAQKRWIEATAADFSLSFFVIWFCNAAARSIQSVNCSKVNLDFILFHSIVRCRFHQLKDERFDWRCFSLAFLFVSWIIKQPRIIDQRRWMTRQWPGSNECRLGAMLTYLRGNHWQSAINSDTWGSDADELQFQFLIDKNPVDVVRGAEHLEMIF